MDAPVEIALPKEPDLQRLFSLAQGTFGQMPGWSDRQVLDTLERDMVFVARDGAQPAGYVALQPDFDTHVVRIDQILVAPGHERRGIGHRLLAHAEGYAIAQGAEVLRIVVEESNWRARTFYRRSGFVPVQTELMELLLPCLH
jgi:ribosomal protein S18 acetylase RimI-like enzyme